MEVWMNKLSGQIVLAQDVYTVTPDDAGEPHGINVDLFQFFGVAIKIETGLIIVFPEEAKDQFEVIGEF